MMPELTEVENYLRQFEPLVSTCKVKVECPSKAPPKSFLSQRDIALIEKCFIWGLERKGKLIRVLLKTLEDHDKVSFLYFHMGMTGRISTPDNIPSLESLTDNDTYPPPHTHLILKSNGHEISFSDPRKFGGVCLNSAGKYEKQWEEFAIDAMDANASLSGYVGRKKGIKTLLLDQRAVVSGVGNWIADEVLYQCNIHPDQTYLTENEVDIMEEKLKKILTVGIQCLDDGNAFPSDWIFQSRWQKRGKEPVIDSNGHTVSFVTSGGRTSAIVAKFQKKMSRKPPAIQCTENADSNDKIRKVIKRENERGEKKIQRNTQRISSDGTRQSKRLKNQKR